MTWIFITALFMLTWFSVRYAWWRRALSDAMPRILMYHMIAPHQPGARFNGLRVSPEKFELQLGWLREHGWTSYTMSELMEMGDQFPSKAVVLTFDDGYRDNITAALPLLEKYDFKATLYLVVDRFENDWSMNRKSHHNEGELMHEAKLDNDQVHHLLASGRFELASHSLTHPNFLHCDNDQLQKELVDSRKNLEAEFSVPVKSFAYPFGLYRTEQIPVVEASGYSTAVTTEEGLNTSVEKNRFQLKRVKVSGRDTMLGFKMRMRTGHRGLFR